MEREIREEMQMDNGGEIHEKTGRLSPSALKLYETQFFGFTPETCMLRVFSAFEDCLCDILPVVEKVCVRQLGKGEAVDAEEALRARARECTLKLQQFLVERFKQLSERMEALLVNRCLTIPPNVLLPEDRSHRRYTQDSQELHRLESSLENLWRSYEAEMCAKEALLSELEEQREVQNQLNGLLMWVQELQAAWATEGNSSFHESFQVVTESVKKLQKALREVCKKAPQ